jgi:hypothetical protein
MNRKRPREEEEAASNIDISRIPMSLLSDLIVQTAFATPQDKWNDAVMVFIYLTRRNLQRVLICSLLSLWKLSLRLLFRRRQEIREIPDVVEILE